MSNTVPCCFVWQTHFKNRSHVFVIKLEYFQVGFLADTKTKRNNKVLPVGRYAI